MTIYVYAFRAELIMDNADNEANADDYDDVGPNDDAV